jgi:hypothetical protein
MNPARPLIPRGSSFPNQGAARGNAILEELLTELALTLLPRGMTPKRFNEVSRYAFACAAATISRLQSGKVNQSRVAALTGLSRAEVKKLLLEGDSGIRGTRSKQTPIERVLDGWRADRRFVDKHGNPKPLRISGAAPSFAFLAKQYGGDVPHRAVLDELYRMGALRRDGNNVVLKTTRALRKRYNFTSLSSVLPALVDGIRLASTTEIPNASSSIYRLTLPARTELDVAVMRERCSSSVTSMLHGLKESLGKQPPVPKGEKGLPPRSFTVTVLLVENKAKESIQKPVPGAAVRSRGAVKKA